MNANFKTAMELNGLRPKTIERYIYWLTLAKKNNAPLDNIEDFNSWLVSSDFAVSTKCGIANAFKKYWELTKNKTEAKTVISIRFRSHEKDFVLSQAEINRMIEVCEDEELRLFTLFLRDTGMRKGILLNLTPNMIDKEGKISIPPDIYGNKGRVKIVHKLTPEALANYSAFIRKRKILPGRKIFRFKNLRNVDSDLCHCYRRLARKAGIARYNEVSPHVLRHSFASHFVEKRGDLYRLAKLLGHKNIQSTERYSHLKEEEVLKELEKVRGLRK
jgi:integrase